MAQENKPETSYSLSTSSGNGGNTVTPSLASLLGPKPVFSRKSVQEKEHSTIKLAKNLFFLTAFLFLITYGFFHTQLNPNFTWFSDQMGPNVASRFESGNSQLMLKQNELNLVRFKMARLILDEINSQIDSYQMQASIINSQISTNVEKETAKTELQILTAAIKKSLQDVKKIFSQPFGIDTFSRRPISQEEREGLYKTSLKEILNEQKEALASEDQPNLEEIRIVDNVLRLVENETFRNIILTQDLEKISEEDFGALLAKIREEGTDELSAIDKIRHRRLDWTKIIQDVHTVTAKADPYYGQGLFKTVGGFLFSSYSFDSKTGRISIQGITKRSDSKTFSAIAELIDSIEKSPMFKDIDFRTFTKSKDEGGDFSSSLNLDFSIQNGRDPRDEILSSNS